MEPRTRRVAIFGAGHVGATFAYGLLLSGVASEIALIDRNVAKAEGEAMDMEHSLPFTPPTRLLAGGFEQCKGAAVTVISAGIPRQPGESRLDLARKNASMMAELAPQIAEHNPDGIIVVATNPVDVLTYIAAKTSGLPPGRVVGTGTLLDTARFRSLLSQHFAVDAHSVHAYIIGEHGDSEVPVWSLANIAGMRLPSFCKNRGVEYDVEAMQRIFENTRDAGAAVISRKGATYYAIATTLVKIVSSVLRDQNTVLSVSSLINDYYGVDDVCLSLPTIIDRSGVKEVLRLQLSPTEIEQLQHSASVLKSIIADVNTQPPTASSH
jgi:L-lactate dehydrogenase